MRAVVIERDEDVAELLSVFFAMRGHETIVAPSADDALSTLVARRCEVVVIDIVDRVLVPHAFVRAVRERLGDRAPLFVGLTGPEAKNQHPPSSREHFFAIWKKTALPERWVEILEHEVARRAR